MNVTRSKKMNQKIPRLRFPEFKGEWKAHNLSEFLTLYSKNNKDEEFSIDDILSLSSHYGIVSRKELLEDTYSGVNHLNYKKTRLNDFVYGKSISAKYPFGLFKVNDYKDGLLSTLYFTFKVKENVDPKFLDYYFSEPYRANSFLKKYVLVGDRYITAEADYLLSGQINIPALPEQQRIVSFLKLVDQCISNLKIQSESLEKYKKEITRNIFSQKFRFKDIENKEFPKWKKIELGQLLKEVSEKTKESKQYPVLSSTMKGIFLQSDYFTRDVASSDDTGYKILRKKQLVFSPQNLWLGNINICTNFDIGIVSPSYKIYDINENIILVDYIKNVIKSPRMLYEYELASEQGASVVRRNLNIDLFNSIMIQVPSIEEQQKISDFLNTLDNLDESKQNQLKKLRLWKKSLLQRLFI